MVLAPTKRVRQQTVEVPMFQILKEAVEDELAHRNESNSGLLNKCNNGLTRCQCLGF